MVIKDVSAATMYDVLHDGQYRRNWDPTMEDSYDIARLSANADMGCYSCKNSVCVTWKVIHLKHFHTSERGNANAVNMFLQKKNI